MLKKITSGIVSAALITASIGTLPTSDPVKDVMAASETPELCRSPSEIALFLRMSAGRSASRMESC